MERGVNEVGEVFRRGFGKYKSGKNLSFRAYKVAKDIMECRTARLGGHKLTCHSCGDVRISYNSWEEQTLSQVPVFKTGTMDTGS
ncbi:MAG: transposase zinc-binding domain-containing protein [Saprospiraceae bacterium]|nr:transposase zinc-binding domain-containing protein [Saprospiraceae bacterium]